MLRTVPLILSTAALLALAACGNSQDPSVLTSQNFESVTDLKEVVEQRGVTCGSDKVSTGDGYKESLGCGQNVWLTVFDTSAEKQERVKTYEEKGSTYVEGRNWVVVAPEQILQELTG